MRWRLILEEFGPELKYIKGEKNVVADALYRLDMSDNQEILNISKIYGCNDDDLTYSANPIFYHDITKTKKTDAKLKQDLVLNKDYTINTFRGGNQNHCLISINRRICLLTALQNNTVDWYHEMLCHLGKTRTDHTLRQHID